MSVHSYDALVKAHRGTSKYMRDRREASKRVKQIREKSGPRSMEWVQSALFLYAAKKYGLARDLRRALWAYTSAMVVKLEEFVSNSDKFAPGDTLDDKYHWTALQLRSAIRTHMKLLDMFKDEVIQLPDMDDVGKGISRITHRPSYADDYEAMTYMISDYGRYNPEVVDLLPKKDDPDVATGLPQE